jgi:hypothetical protein
VAVVDTVIAAGSQGIDPLLYAGFYWTGDSLND